MHRSLPALATALMTAAALPGCGIHGPYNAEARDTWARSYTLSKSGEVSVSNVNGRVVIEGVEGSSVQVEAERISHAATEQLAKDLLPKISINDRSTPDLVFIETGRIRGILIGASYEVRYHVKVPKTASVKATTVNGGVEVIGLAGRTAGYPNGFDVTMDYPTKFARSGVSFDLVAQKLQADLTEAGIRVTLPEKAKATVNATWVNGGFNSPGLSFDVGDSGRRHFEGLLNGGGTQINATTVNGGVRIVSTNHKDDAGEDDDHPKVVNRLAQ